MTAPPPPLGPTHRTVLDPHARPYFLWWTDLTVDAFRARLSEGSDEDRAYWMGALLREANTRDVWCFVTPAQVRALWPLLARHLGRSRAMWQWLLELPDAPWPPPEARGA